jgi:protein-L-isoaspartate(D-aspartate) O-methyltransferase
MLDGPLSEQDLVVAARSAGVRDPRVLRALSAVDRVGFVPRRHASLAHRDVPVPIPHDQVTTQPSLTARMLEGLALRGPERVLEVGTGYGFQTAVLAALCRRPYQAILVSAAAPVVPRPLVAQLAPHGRLVQPIGHGGHERVTLFRKGSSERLQAVRVLTGAHFVPLHRRHGLAG